MMKRALAFQAALVLLTVTPAFAQRAPIAPAPLTRAPSKTPTPTPAPTPIGPNLGGAAAPRATAVAPPTSGGNAVGGIAVGSPISVVDAKCKETGVKCLRTTRRINASISLGRVRIDFPSGEFTRVYVTERGGTILSVKGRYRTEDKARQTNMSKALGRGTSRRGAVAWAPATANGVVTELDARGQSIRYIDTKAANAKSVAVSPAQLLAVTPKLDSIRPASATSMAPPHVLSSSAALGGNAGELKLELPPTARVTNPLKIPVKFVFDELRCFAENDPTSWFYGDDPYLKFVGTHTGPYPLAWHTTKGYSDVESGNNLKLATAVFPNGDPRRFVTIGEAVGVQFTLFESDDASFDDEVDFAYPIVDYAFAHANQGKTVPFTETLSGNGGVYTVAYRVEIGVGIPDPGAITGPGHVYRPAASPQTYAGSYAGSVGDGAAEASLSFLPSRDPLFPAGVLYGSLKGDGTSASVRTIRLQGGNIELLATYPSGSPATIVGYLVGSGSDLRVVGTITRDGISRGISLTKK